MKTDISMKLSRLHADLIADLILKTPREQIPLHVDYDYLCEFVEAVENAKRLEQSIYNCGLRQFGMQSLCGEEISEFDITPKVALALAGFMTEYRRIHHDASLR
ncbi:hypothetical protein AVU18_gp215 [Citrobacter phage IME-CF2]|jgi:hypothetical protein|uniref:Uncharacterized protein n=5 Tax=Pseudotevenvirus TaxID=2842979 RepID=A0A1B1IXP4_9CAUD|nr:hypothetical protein CPTMiller_0022 [Citrobacter phage Miller]YP_009218707.1 hypothetical protein AVU18_gp215 [Citrobacter phage IME-CF2]YP_009285561.1 hypothetical protein BI032_gp023 [Citrobacter phage vB_CfrM_CfP1]YP_238998.1 hypothetical protein RB43ORF022c [Escherichia phage RB43]QPX73113.1 hypothetical protein [Citrobacter phage vB_Cfr_Xman]CCK73870.1 protein of unknown function [Pseudotevenvirus RB43]AAX78544.1 hypothetical protein RB43ORF022c [Escherichia phage RB43]AIK67958.1 hyp